MTHPEPPASADEHNPPGGLGRTLWRRARKLVILIIGVTVILLGCVLIFTPGPAVVVIPAGIAILATEFVWARKLLLRFKASAVSAAKAARGKNEPESQELLVFYKRYWRRCCQIVQSGIAPFRKDDTPAPFNSDKPSADSSSSQD
jgi:uncharacterized protein (TIGR02611 family)